MKSRWSGLKEINAQLKKKEEVCAIGGIVWNLMRHLQLDCALLSLEHHKFRTQLENAKKKAKFHGWWTFLTTNLLRQHRPQGADASKFQLQKTAHSRKNKLFWIFHFGMLSFRSIFLFVLVFVTLCPANAIRSFPYKLIDSKDDTQSEFIQFIEAPEYQNGPECPVLSTNAPASSCDSLLVHIAMTLDSVYLRGSIAAVHSVLKHTFCPENVYFHFIASDSNSPTPDDLATILKSTFPSLNFRVYNFSESLVKNLISPSIRQALENPLNYARTYLADILEPCVDRVIYLDSDIIVVDDIQKLWSIPLTKSRAIGVPEYCHVNFTKYFTDEFWFDSQLPNVFEGKKPCYFNTGVMVMDLVRWREGNYRMKIEKWMETQREKRIYELGSLPPFLLVFGGDVEAIDHRWNQHGLGGDNVVNSCRSLHPGRVSLLHWSGKGKPWVRLDAGFPCPVDRLWAPYDLYRSHGVPQHNEQR
ncbi:hypothetical protein F0562_004997 [Nyssa sinensis]|uniref:Hexosyltransferase n=1 Tax=Nyssa sinensis TaxID=561372 RepID=A0A5J5AJD1_9ASTE|nr:hypothetical protein F0562_004997 [Nyssa sinensis]